MAKLDPVITLPHETTINIFCNLNERDLLAVSHVSRLWRRVAKDDYLWTRKITERWVEDYDDGRKIVKNTRRENYYERAKLYISFAGGICQSSSSSFFVINSAQSRFDKVLRLTSTNSFKVSFVAKQVPPGTYEVCCRSRFDIDAKSNGGVWCRTSPLKSFENDDSCSLSTNMIITPYCIFVYRSFEWVITCSAEYITVSETNGPRDLCMEFFSRGGDNSREIDFDYFYIRDVTTSYFNGHCDTRLPFRDGPEPQRLDKKTDPNRPYSKISAAFFID